MLLKYYERLFGRDYNFMMSLQSLEFITYIKKKI